MAGIKTVNWNCERLTTLYGEAGKMGNTTKCASLSIHAGDVIANDPVWLSTLGRCL